MPKPLLKLQRLLQQGLTETAALWPPLEDAFGWVAQVARILSNDASAAGAQVRQHLTDLLASLALTGPPAGPWADALEHLQTVTRSYWLGLFHCYDVPDLPRTNNDLEHFFGSFRYHERRASGRRGAAPSLVVRGPARLVAATATRQRPFSATDLAACDRHAWRALRSTLNQRGQARVNQRRFRADPSAYLAILEQLLCKLTLPP